MIEVKCILQIVRFTILKVPIMLKLAVFVIFFAFYPLASSAKGIEEFVHSIAIEAPDIEFSDSEGAIHTLKSLRGKVVLLNFWATWCKPCVMEMPALSRLQEALRDEPVVVLPLSLDSNGGIKKVEAFYEEREINNLSVYVDEAFKTYAAFSVRALPSTYIIDPKGNIVATVTGVYEWDGEDVKAYLLSLKNAR